LEWRLGYRWSFIEEHDEWNDKHDQQTGDKTPAMIDLRKYKRTASLVAILGFLSVAMFLFAQAPTSKSDTDQITGLMADLSNHSKAPADVLDPNLSGSDRSMNLRRFSATPYELSIVPNGGTPAITGDLASVPVRVHYKAEDGNSLDASATAQFVRRNGSWYFASFDFMKWPAFLIVVLIVCILIGVGYAVVVLVLWSRLRKHGLLGANAIKMFIPLFWSSLFRQTR
jgi:hypothetical protein